MSDDGSRADRLRRRREKQRDQQVETAEPSESSEPDETSESATSAGSSDDGGTTSVKDDRVGTYMYLPEDQRAELDFAYKELSLTYEREFGDEIEKNRHFYPLLVQAGLEHLDDLDGDAIRERLESFEP